MTIILLDAASLTKPEDHAQQVNGDSRFQKKLRRFPQHFNNGAKTLGNLAKKNLRERQKDSANNINDMIRGNIGPYRLKLTKSTLMKDDAKYFHATLGASNKQTVLPSEIGKGKYFEFGIMLNLLCYNCCSGVCLGVLSARDTTLGSRIS